MSKITTITMVASPLGLALFGALFDWQTTQPRLRDSLIFLEIQLENLHFLYTFLAAFFIHFWLLSLYPSTILHLSIRKKDKHGFWK